jgi:hypothetical protein
MKCYKLTDQNHKTRDNTQWGHGVTHTVLGNNTSLCSSSWLHFYTNPLIAVLVNPIHADIRNPVLWEAESSGEELHEKLKSGSKTLTTTRIIELPIITTTQKVAFSILCTKQLTNSSVWVKWADGWLSGLDRSRKAALDNTYFYGSVDATYNAANAAVAAADAATYAAFAAAYAANVATNAANAADYANANSLSVDFVELANQAMKY